jgi:arginine deiminase
MNPSSTDTITDDLHEVNSRCEAKTEEEIVAEPLPTDVLFGRDKQMINHVGNVRFRLVIQARAKEYEFAPSR